MWTQLCDPQIALRIMAQQVICHRPSGDIDAILCSERPMNQARERKLSFAMVLCVIVAQAIVCSQELNTASAQNNDCINHFTMTKQMVQEIERGGNPLDFWSAEISLGVPMVR